jgi:hypothetical protein
MYLTRNYLFDKLLTFDYKLHGLLLITKCEKIG